MRNQRLQTHSTINTMVNYEESLQHG